MQTQNKHSPAHFCTLFLFQLLHWLSQYLLSISISFFLTFFSTLDLFLLHCLSQSRKVFFFFLNRKTTNSSIPAPHDSFPRNRSCHFIIYLSAFNILQSELFLHLHNEVMVILMICHFIRCPLNFFLTGKSRRCFMLFIAASFLDSLHLSILSDHILLILFLIFTLFFQISFQNLIQHHYLIVIPSIFLSKMLLCILCTFSLRNLFLCLQLILLFEY